MDWDLSIEAIQWGLICFLFFKGVKNEIRIDEMEGK